MAIILPTFNPVATYSRVNEGYYVDEATNLSNLSTLRVQSTLKANGVSNFVVRFDFGKLVESNRYVLSTYMVTRGPLHLFTEAEKQIGYDRTRLVLSNANVARIERGER